MKLLVAVDDTNAAGVALDWACEFLRGEADDSTAEVLNVWKPMESIGIDGFGLMLDSDYPSSSEQLLASLLHDVGDPDAFHQAVGSGRPEQSILVAADDCDLLVMGTRSGGAARQALLGSMSQAVVTGAQCPVAVVPETSPDPGGLTLVAWDDSPGSHAAFSWALEHRNVSMITVVHVREPHREPRDETEESALQRVRAEILASHGLDGDEVTIEVHHGEPATTLVSAIESAGELVVGQRATFGPKDSIWGSVTSHVMSRSSRPVIVVPAGPSATAEAAPTEI
jgi:nucleotide-binding universal stress UspA family protein